MGLSVKIYTLSVVQIQWNGGNVSLRNAKSSIQKFVLTTVAKDTVVRENGAHTHTLQKCGDLSTLPCHNTRGETRKIKIGDIHHLWHIKTQLPGEIKVPHRQEMQREQADGKTSLF